MTTIYRLKISLVEPNYSINRLHRIVEVSGNITFNQLHAQIFELFERYDEHLWQFFISRTKMDSFKKLFDNCHETVAPPDVFDFNKDEQSYLNELNDRLQQNGKAGITKVQKINHNATISLDELHLTEKGYFYYWFDFGDDWLHRIRIEKIFDSDMVVDGYHFAVIKAVGDIPPQYNDFDDDFENPTDNTDESDADVLNNLSTLFDLDNISMELDFELSLISAMILIAGDPTNPTRFGDLVEIGIADELIRREMIKPCTNLSHRVRLTPKGESKVAQIVELMEID